LVALRRNSREALEILRDVLDDEPSAKDLIYAVVRAIRKLEACDCACCDDRGCHCGGICTHRGRP
jgi:hypothetical protein